MVYHLFDNFLLTSVDLCTGDLKLDRSGRAGVRVGRGMRRRWLLEIFAKEVRRQGHRHGRRSQTVNDFELSSLGSVGLESYMDMDSLGFEIRYYVEEKGDYCREKQTITIKLSFTSLAFVIFCIFLSHILLYFILFSYFIVFPCTFMLVSLL